MSESFPFKRLVVAIMPKPLIAFCLLFGLLWGGMPQPTAADVQRPVPARSAGPGESAASAAKWDLSVRSIGPAVMGGRITDLQVYERRPATFYAAAATGGLWRTDNGGTTWTPLFDDQPTHSIGAIGICQARPDVIYVGTGEANLRNSVSYGDGVYKSEDGGKTWTHVGLSESRHIGRIVVHPTEPDVAYVAALGRAWGPSRQRGLFKTTDGGKNWTNTHDLGPDCGFIDLVMDPSDPATLYAAAYQVRRGLGSGDGKIADRPETEFGRDAGIYKTTDAGRTWTRLSKGLPRCRVGRVGLAIYRKNPKIVYAVIQTEKTDTRKIGGPPADSNQDAETGGVFRSDDAGESWVKLNNLCPRPFYFSKIRVDPNDDRRVYVLGIALHVSSDGGKTFSPDGARKVHADHHALWINPADSDHMILGNDGGLYATADRGRNWEAIHNLPLAQYYGVAVDGRDPYWVYGGMQDNGSWGGPSRTRRLEGIGNADWVKIDGGDGFRAAVDPDNPNIIYCTSQYGRLVRFHRDRREIVPIQPKPPAGAEPYRFNWNSPLVLSPHDPRTLYFGGQYVFQSSDQGRSWKILSPDLTRGRPDTGTLTALAQSPRDADVLWAGSADGLLHVSRDGGKNWKSVTPDEGDRRRRGVLHAATISGIECCPHDAATAYLAVDRHRADDERPYLFCTKDYGETWQPLAAGLPPMGHVHVVRADRKNRSLLYVGTEFGLFFTLDGGKTWNRLKYGLPTVAVADLVVHPRDNELVVGTHGRGVYIVDVAPLQQLDADTLMADAYLFDLRPARLLRLRSEQGTTGGAKQFYAPNPPVGSTIYYYLGKPAEGPVRITIADAAGKTLHVLEGQRRAGLHSVFWDLRPRTRAGGEPGGPDDRGCTAEDDKIVAGPPAAGMYTVTLHAAGTEWTKKLKVEADE